ncbi:hypothetical protein HMI54_006532 [Coelomomyces lativittatus]|nr:hypothetical protein HMI54_006532 [Coelomomyces lativittatus]
MIIFRLHPSSIPQEVPIKLDSTQPKSGFTRFFRQPSKPTLSSDPVPSTSMMSSTPKSIPSMPLNLNLNSSPMVPLFGGSLTQLIVHDTLPPFILDCLHVLSTKGKDVQGLYRVSGHSPSIQRLKHHCYDTSRRWMEEDEDIHVISGTFKLFLRELKEPVFPFALYPTFIQLGKERNQDVRLPLLKHWIRQLPRSHLVMAKHLFLHLNALEKSKELTKMDATNLSIVFGPNLLRPQIDTMETILNADAQNLIIKDLILEAEHWCHDWLDEGL